MAVRLHQRSQCELEVFIKVESLLEYTDRKIQRKDFYKWKTADRLYDLAYAAWHSLIDANRINVIKEPAKKDVRLNLIRFAISQLEEYQDILNYIIRRFSSTKKIKFDYWVSIYEDAMNLTKKFLESEIKRYEGID